MGRKQDHVTKNKIQSFFRDYFNLFNIHNMPGKEAASPALINRHRFRPSFLSLANQRTA
jgi:DNA primase catalytic subunit